MKPKKLRYWYEGEWRNNIYIGFAFGESVINIDCEMKEGKLVWRDIEWNRLSVRMMDELDCKGKFIWSGDRVIYRDPEASGVQLIGTVEEDNKVFGGWCFRPETISPETGKPYPTIPINMFAAPTMSLEVIGNAFERPITTDDEEDEFLKKGNYAE